MYETNEGCSGQVAEGKEWDGLDERHVLAGSPGTFHSLVTVEAVQVLEYSSNVSSAY